MIFTQVPAASSQSTFFSSPLTSPSPRQKRARFSSPWFVESAPRRRNMPHLSLEITHKILEHVDPGTLLACRTLNHRFKNLVHPYVAPSIAYKHEDICIDYKHFLEEKSKSEILLHLMDCFPLGQYVRSIRVNDSKASEGRVRMVRWPHLLDLEELEDHKEAARKRFEISPGNIHHDEALVKLLPRLTQLESITFVAVCYDFDWDFFQRQHNLSRLFSMSSLTNITFRGMTNVPLAQLEKVTTLEQLSLSNYGVLFPDSEAAVLDTPRVFLDVLQLKNIKCNITQMAAYLDSSRSTLNISNLRQFSTDIVHQNDVTVAAAVLRTGTDLEKLEISTWFHHFARGSNPSDIILDDIDLSSLQKLRHLYVRLSFRDGVESEMDWFVNAIITFPTINSLESVYLKIDIGITDGTPESIDVQYDRRTLLGRYAKWETLVNSLEFDPKFQHLGRLDFVVSSPDDFDKYENTWTLDQDVPAISKLRRKDGLKFSVHETAEFTSKYRHRDSSFTYLAD